MKRYLIAITLGTLIGPPIGATIYGSLMGNPFIIIYPIVLLVAYMMEGIPFIVFGSIGALIHKRASNRRRQPSLLLVIGYGALMGTCCGAIPLLFAVEFGHWSFNRSILSFIATGTITGVICALIGSRFLNRNKGGEPAPPPYSSPAAGSESGEA
jgi:hypothetical protein